MTATPDDLREALVGMVEQFAYHTVVDGKPAFWCGGLSALEEAFWALGWENPHPAPSEYFCDVFGCDQFYTAGVPFEDGYRHLCGKHYDELRKEKDDHAKPGG